LGTRRSARLSLLDFLVLSSPNPFGLLLLRPPHRDLAGIAGRFSSGTRYLGDIPNGETAGKQIQHGIPIYWSGSSGLTTPSSRSLCLRVPARQEPIDPLVLYQIILKGGQFGNSLTYLLFKPVDLSFYRRDQIFGHRVPPKMFLVLLTPQVLENNSILYAL
jgi:hypothetical protein